jgi:DNA-binding CsgD family transcriptional regulator
MLGRPTEAARLAKSALEALHVYGRENSTLSANWIEALVATGEWDEADRVSAAALRAITPYYPHMRLLARAELEVGRGAFDEARAHLEAAVAAVDDDHSLASCDAWVAELALWERRWTDAAEVVRGGLARANSRDAAYTRLQLATQGVRAQAELAALARAGRNTDDLRDLLGEARKLLARARRAAKDAARVTSYAACWRRVAEAEYGRARGEARPDAWSEAAAAWDQLDRPPLAAYCRWRQAEALVSAGASRPVASLPLRAAYDVATRLGAKPLLQELELLAERARLDLIPPSAEPSHRKQGMEELLGLTPREAEVLSLVARGYTNREIADTLVISVKTAGVHVSHILRKLDTPNRREAAAIAHRVAPPPSGLTPGPGDIVSGSP